MMRLNRRDALSAGGLLLAGLWRPASAADGVELTMQGTADGSAVWFDPIGILVQPGETLRWTNRDPGNSHTVTAYHPANGRPLRIPAGADPWDSGYLLPGETFAVTLVVPGVYDYHCIPHEHAGMVGRIVVASGAEPEPADASGDVTPLPEAALRAFPAVGEILAKRTVRVEAAR